MRRTLKALILAGFLGVAVTAQTSPAFAKSTPKKYTGPTIYEEYGAIRVRIFISHKRIIKIQVASAAESERSFQENSAAIPVLRKETLRAQSAHVSSVSGATATSDAYIQSAARAIAKARKAKSL